MFVEYTKPDSAKSNIMIALEHGAIVHHDGRVQGERLEGEQRRHDLRQARRRHALIDVLFGEHVTRVEVDEDVCGRIDLGRRRRRSHGRSRNGRGVGRKREQWPKGKRDDDP